MWYVSAHINICTYSIKAISTPHGACARMSVTVKLCCRLTVKLSALQQCWQAAGLSKRLRAGYIRTYGAGLSCGLTAVMCSLARWQPLLAWSPGSPACSQTVLRVSTAAYMTLHACYDYFCLCIYTMSLKISSDTPQQHWLVHTNLQSSPKIIQLINHKCLE